MGLEKYKAKREFAKTPEPKGKAKLRKKGLLHFVVQKHQARQLHYDFRLEHGGVLKSWAVPKGPSMNPREKRLAMLVEDHPYEYLKFEGIIPKGNYGAGRVRIWDEGTYTPLENMKKGLKIGNLKFVLLGKKLKGEFVLIKLFAQEGLASRSKNAWLLIKKNEKRNKIYQSR